MLINYLPILNLGAYYIIMFKKAQSILIVISLLTLHEMHKRKNVIHTEYDTEVRTKRTVPIKRVEINIPRKCHDC